jgi:hypothetical protein
MTPADDVDYSSRLNYHVMNAPRLVAEQQESLGRQAYNSALFEAARRGPQNDPGPSSYLPGLSGYLPEQDQSLYGYRADGSPKGKGYFGPLLRADGKTITELSIGVEFDGVETEIPLLVPTFTREEILIAQAGLKPTQAMIDKAIEFAKQRMANGRSVWAEENERYELPSFTHPSLTVPKAGAQ